MRTSMLLAIFAISGVVAFAGLAAAAGTDIGVVSSHRGMGSGNGMMANNGGCNGPNGQSAQYQYMQEGACSGGCQYVLSNNNSWSYGECNMTSGDAGYQQQGVCPGTTCDNDYQHSYSWNYSNSYCGM